MAIPLPTRRALDLDPFMRVCIHRAFIRDPTPCRGKIDWEHAMSKMGYNCQEPWALVPACHDEHHQGPGLDKKFNVLIALCRATDAQLRAASKAEDLIQRRKYLLNLYAPRLTMNALSIPKAPVCQ